MVDPRPPGFATTRSLYSRPRRWRLLALLTHIGRSCSARTPLRQRLCHPMVFSRKDVQSLWTPVATLSLL